MTVIVLLFIFVVIDRSVFFFVKESEEFSIIYPFFREVTFVPSRGLWSTEPTAEIIEDPWSISSTSTATSSNPADKSLSLSPFRQAANELERLQREARELARRKAEEEQTEQREAHEGKTLTKKNPSSFVSSMFSRSTL